MMERLLAVVAVLSIGSAGADETTIKSAEIPASVVRSIRRVDVRPTNGAVVHVAWNRDDIQLVAQKTAADKATLDLVRVSATVDRGLLTISVGENVSGSWRPLRPGSKVDLTINLPARLTSVPRRPPLEPAIPDNLASLQSQ